MNTPAHAVVNLALLERRIPGGTVWPVLLGAVLPDVPIFAFYAHERGVLRVPEAVIWTHDYFVSAWQPVIDALHSFPLILLGLAVAAVLKSPRAMAFCVSLFFHSLGDFPLHHDDAHRQFFPFSDFRFRSPISYWDPRHHGAVGALVELTAVAAASIALGRRHPSIAVRCFLGLLTAAYAAAYVIFY